MRHVFLLSAAGLALVVPGALLAQQGPTEQGRQPSRFEREMQARAEAGRQQTAQSEAAARRMLERDIAVGNMTPEQQAQFGHYVQDRIQAVIPSAQNLARATDQAGRSMMQNVEVRADSRAFDPANQDRVTDREYSEAVAHGAVELETQAIAVNRVTLREGREFMDQMARASRDIMQERERIIASNANVSAAERARVRTETAEVENGTAAFQRTSEQRFNQADYNLRERERRVREAESTVARRIEEQVVAHGRDGEQWDVPGNAPARQTAQRTPTASQPTANAPTEPPSASRARQSTASRTTPRASDPRGTQGDLSQGPRVPRSQGGTGPETPESRAAANTRAQVQRRAQQQAQDERNTSRTEQLRQQAMEQARRDNQTADSAWNSPELRRALDAAVQQLQREAELDNVRQEIERFARPGQVGRGGSATGGSGSAGAGGTASLFGFFPGLFGSGDLSVDQLIALVAATRERVMEDALHREATRLADERARLAAAAQRRTAQDQRWRDMVTASFRTFQSPGWRAFDDLDPLQRGALYDAVWNAFERNGGNLTTLQLEDIYRNYNPLNTIPPAMSLSSAGNSLSAAGRSLSAAGTPVRSGTDNYDDPAVQSLYQALYTLTSRRRGPLGPSEEDIRTANRGDYDLQTDPTGRLGRESGGYVAASLFSGEVDYLTRSFVNGRNGLQGLLAQPFNVLLTWGAGANDIDLHMTGPTGPGNPDRFHIFFAARGSLQSFPFAELIRDCICKSGSEVILTSSLLGGGVYRVSAFNFGDQSATSTNLSNAAEARIQIVRGGVAVPQGNGTTIQGGRLILDTRAPVGQPGNTWVAVELDPSTGRITVPARITQSRSAEDVH